MMFLLKQLEPHMTSTHMANMTASATMTSIASSPFGLRAVRNRACSVRLPRCGDHAVCGGAPPGQFDLQFFGLLFHSHPAEFANPFDEIIRPAIGLCRNFVL